MEMYLCESLWCWINVWSCYSLVIYQKHSKSYREHVEMVAQMACDRSSSTASRECRDPRMLQEELKLPIAAPFRMCPISPIIQNLSKLFKVGRAQNEIRPVTGKSVYLEKGVKVSEGQWRSQNDNVKSSQLQVVYLASSTSARQGTSTELLRWNEIEWDEMRWNEMNLAIW